jgi:hypothetical protein
VVDERARRIGENEALFREVNERVQELDERFGAARTFEIVCECGNDTCFERIGIDRGAYEAVRNDARTFAVVPGHELPDLEDVVEQHDAYFVVRKKVGPGASVAQATDPR